MKKKINVTKRDIQLGEKDNALDCPVALAVKRHLPSRCLQVGSETVTFDCGSIFLPESAREFIHRFDTGKRVKPFSFTLEIP